MEEAREKNYWDSLKSQFSAFHNSPYNLYAIVLQVFVLKSAVNFIIYLLSIYYIEIWNIDDRTAGYIVSLCSIQGLFIFVGGNIVDRIGIKNSYYLISALGCTAYGIFLFLKNLILHIVVVIVLIGFLTILIFTTLKTNLTLLANNSNRSLGFSLLHIATQSNSMMYGGVIKVIFYLYDVSTKSFNIIFIITIGFFIFSAILNYFFIKSEDSHIAKRSSTFSAFHNIKEAVNMKRFWKLLIVDLISSIPLTLIYEVGMILPIYMDRELDDNSNYGLFILGYSILTIIFSLILTPIFTWLTPYNLMIISAGILSCAPLILVISRIYILITAFGSSIFETRISEYHAHAALPGMRGTYITIVNVSYALAFLVTGITTGYTLEAFCPEDGERKSWAMWLIVSGSGFFGFILFIITKNWLEFKHDHEDYDPYVYSGNKE